MGNSSDPVALLFALLEPGCLEFRGVGPENADPVHPPQIVNVTIAYRQPNFCENTTSSCDHPVIFFVISMRPGAEFELTQDPNSFVHRGTALAVPVNFPPHDD